VCSGNSNLNTSLAVILPVLLVSNTCIPCQPLWIRLGRIKWRADTPSEPQYRAWIWACERPLNAHGVGCLHLFANRATCFACKVACGC
jgi:hypothetical protein